MIDIKLPDANFDLRNVSDEEIYEALKGEILSVIKSYNGFENVTSEDLKLLTKYTRRRDDFGADKNLYHNIVLDVGVKVYLGVDSFNLFINPFSIKIAKQEYGAETYEDKDLTKAFVKFMLKKFPTSDYVSKRKDYFKNAEMLKKFREEMLYF